MKKNRSSEPPARPGSQEEPSMLFSLGELRAKAASVVPPPPRKEENSGLIDLHALMAQAEREEKAKEEERGLRVSQHIGVYPFGAPPPVEATAVTPAPTSMAAPEPPPAPRGGVGSRRWGAIAVGSTVAGLAVVAAAMSAGGWPSGSPSVAHMAKGALDPAALQSVASPIRKEAASGHLQVSTPRLTPGETAESEASPLPDRPPKVGVHVSKAPRLTRTSPPAGGAAAPKASGAARTPQAGDPCHGDLLCAMERAVKVNKK